MRSWRSYLVYLSWSQSLIATAGSLYFSDVMGLPPCVLCWYQRIFMYPLALILPLGIALQDWRIKYYGLALSLVGLTIAIYHNLLYYGLITEGVTPCTRGVSCTSQQIMWGGFISIPLLSLVAFTVISVALLMYQPEETNT
jgi:disulfide bond formation protein DsbB